MSLKYEPASEPLQHVHGQTTRQARPADGQICWMRKKTNPRCYTRYSFPVADHARSQLRDLPNLRSPDLPHKFKGGTLITANTTTMLFIYCQPQTKFLAFRSYSYNRREYTVARLVSILSKRTLL